MKAVSSITLRWFLLNIHTLGTHFSHHFQSLNHLFANFDKPIQSQHIKHIQTLNYPFGSCDLIFRFQKGPTEQHSIGSAWPFFLLSIHINRIRFPFFIYCLLYCFSNRFRYKSIMRIWKGMLFRTLRSLQVKIGPCLLHLGRMCRSAERY